MGLSFEGLICVIRLRASSIDGSMLGIPWMIFSGIAKAISVHPFTISSAPFCFNCKIDSIKSALACSVTGLDMALMP